MIVDVDLFKRWDVVAMCLAMAILFVLEMLGVFTHRYVTITAIVRSVPKWGLSMVLGLAGLAFSLEVMRWQKRVRGVPILFIPRARNAECRFPRKITNLASAKPAVAG